MNAMLITVRNDTDMLVNCSPKGGIGWMLLPNEKTKVEYSDHIRDFLIVGNLVLEDVKYSGDVKEQVRKIQAKIDKARAMNPVKTVFDRWDFVDSVD